MQEGFVAQRFQHQPQEPEDALCQPDRVAGVSQEVAEDRLIEEGIITSPVDFYEAIRDRPDIKEILARLARS
jgi:hypothetical protein